MWSGKYHGSIVTNDENMELWCVKAGQNSADLVHPMPYSPELHFPEFNSAIADAKNSVAVSLTLTTKLMTHQ
jgi:probable aminopeptidase NPEPL1